MIIEGVLDDPALFIMESIESVVVLFVFVELEEEERPSCASCWRCAGIAGTGGIAGLGRPGDAGVYECEERREWYKEETRGEGTEIRLGLGLVT
jgi:hypothetical protein